MKHLRPIGAAAIAVLALTAAGCSSSSSSSSTSPSTSGSASAPASAASTGATGSATAAAAGSGFGTPHKATGTPYVFGMINDETGAVTFPEARQGSIAAVDYVNNYLDGINGHPIQIDSCIGDGTPATAARCANQLVADHPIAILGAADVGAPASIPIYAHANLAYLGGIPFTPVPETAAELDPVLVGQRRRQRRRRRLRGQEARRQERRDHLLQQRPGRVDPAPDHPDVQGGRRHQDQDVPLSPTSPDPSPQAALVESSGAQLAYVDIPNGCGNVLKALKSVGYTGKIMGIDPCGAPPVITAAAGGANGMYIASPFQLQTGSSAQAQLFLAAMKQYAAPGTLVDSISTAGFATVMNVQQVLSTIKGTPTTTRSWPRSRPAPTRNFLSHPYTCNGQALKGAPAICNDNYLMNQIENGALTQPSSTDWTTSKGYFPGISG